MSSRSTKIAGPAPVGDASLRWLCNEQSGATTIANTGSKTSGDLSVSDSPTLGLPHPWGLGVRLTGASAQYLYGASGVSLDANAVTVLALVLPVNVNSQYQDAVTKNVGAVGDGGNLPVRLGKHNSAGGIVQSIITTTTSGAVTLVSTAPYVLAGRAHVLGVSYDGSTQRLWLDGEIAASAPQTGTIVWGTGQWTVGADTSTGASGVNPWQGWVGDVRVYERALSQDEIRNIYRDNVWAWGGVVQ